MQEASNKWSVELEDELVRLVPLQRQDFNRLFEVASDPLIWEQHPESDRYKKEVFQKYFDGAMESGSAFLIIDKKNEQVIGCTRYYEYDPEADSIAIGYTFLARKYWGGKYNQTCKKLLLDHAFKYVSKVVFHIGPDNIRSQTAILRTGAVPSGRIRKELNGQPDRNLEFYITKADWIMRIS